MSTLSSLILKTQGKTISEMTEEELTNFIENLRSVRQTISESAFEERKSRRKAAAKRQPKDISQETLNELDDLMDLL